MDIMSQPLSCADIPGYEWYHSGECAGPACPCVPQRRRDFFRLMRRPDAEPLRMLLAYLRFNEGVDWHGITGLKLDAVDPESFIKWIARVQHEPGTSERMVIATGFKSIDDMFTDWLHSDADPACKCEVCTFQTVAHY